METIVYMSFKSALIAWAKRLFCFKGRARRAEYWYPYLIFYLFVQFMTAIATASMTNTFAYIALFFGLIGVVLFLPVTVRRLHDIGLSGYWSTLGYLPLICVLVFLFNRSFVFHLVGGDFFQMMTRLKIVAVGLAICNIAFMVLLMKDGTKGSNKYGDSSKYIDEEGIYDSVRQGG